MDRMNRRKRRRLHGRRHDVEDQPVFGFSVMEGVGGGWHGSIQPLPLPDPLISSPMRGRDRKRERVVAYLVTFCEEFNVQCLTGVVVL